MHISFMRREINNVPFSYSYIHFPYHNANSVNQYEKKEITNKDNTDVNKITCNRVKYINKR